MNTEFQNKKQQILEEKDNYFKGRDTIEYNKEILRNRTPSENELVKLFFQEKQLRRYLEKIINHWTEFIREFIEYCKIIVPNNPMDASLLTFKTEVKELLDFSNELLSIIDYSNSTEAEYYDTLFKQMWERISSEIASLKQICDAATSEGDINEL